jgi:hypothetical protein
MMASSAANIATGTLFLRQEKEYEKAEKSHRRGNGACALAFESLRCVARSEPSRRLLLWLTFNEQHPACARDAAEKDS